MATTLLVAGLTLTLWMTGQMPLQPPAQTQVLFKCCPYNSMQLAYGSFQLMHVTWWPCCSSQASNSSQKGKQIHYSAHNFTTRV